MSELRFNPLLGTWVIHAASRQNRPHLPTTACPFCPSSGKVPTFTDVLVYPNDFPVLSDEPTDVAPHHALFTAAKAYGFADVILYSPDHSIQFPNLSNQHIAKIIDAWQKRNDELSTDPKIKYVYPFENRGEEVGVTIHHPHGQLYAFSWVPLKLAIELQNCSDYFNETGHNFFDVLTEIERAEEKRFIYENELFAAYIPYFTDYPFGVFIVAKDNTANLSQFTPQHSEQLAEILKLVTQGFDALFDKPFPYMMVTHQTPVNSFEYEFSEEYFRFHIEFYPPLRAEDKIKWYASAEMGAWAATNPRSVEECADILRKKINGYIWTNNAAL